MTSPIVFATEAYAYLGRAVAAKTGWEIGAVTRRRALPADRDRSDRSRRRADRRDDR
jgi:hypothetical protein